MGQATVDLTPDPLEQDAAPLAKADDLLAQLAGEEIDRLLAEADGEHRPAREGPPVTEDGSDRLASAEGAVSAQLDELLNQFSEPAVAETAPVVEPPPPSRVEAHAASSSLPQAVEEHPTSAAEASALSFDTSDVVFETGEVSSLPAEPEQAAAAPGRPPILVVRLLELLNAPFAACPDVVRDVLGRVALLTLMNAVGLLLYLLLFRKH